MIAKRLQRVLRYVRYDRQICRPARAAKTRKARLLERSERVCHYIYAPVTRGRKRSMQCRYISARRSWKRRLELGEHLRTRRTLDATKMATGLVVPSVNRRPSSFAYRLLRSFVVSAPYDPRVFCSCFFSFSMLHQLVHIKLLVYQYIV